MLDTERKIFQGFADLLAEGAKNIYGDPCNRKSLKGDDKKAMQDALFMSLKLDRIEFENAENNQGATDISLLSQMKPTLSSLKKNNDMEMIDGICSFFVHMSVRN